MILKPKGRLKAMVALMLEPHSPGSKEIYQEIQAIRVKHDFRHAKWLPHITLISPFDVVSPIPKEHGVRWNKEGVMPPNYSRTSKGQKQ